MLASHNILNPANGAPITVPSQDMVLGLYYMTKQKKSIGEDIVKGEGMKFYSLDEVKIAYNEEKIDLHAIINLRVNDKDGNKLVETTVAHYLMNLFLMKLALLIRF